MILDKINKVMKKAEEAFFIYKQVEAIERAKFIRAISAEIELLGDELIHIAMEESHLPEARLRGERGRTTNQLNAFAALLEAGDWNEVSIDRADADRKPAPKPDLRKMLFPIGPVVVFGASNFPLAFSTAGGDTASALAAGCSVVVKGHPAHPKTSQLVTSAIRKAIQKTAMPENVFQHIEDGSIEAGQILISHSKTKAAAFTGSFQGGKALFDIANKREEPIPFFAEMGSINPVVLLPEAIKVKTDLPALLGGSITLGVGQFCTNPGLLIAIDDENLSQFIDELKSNLEKVSPSKMLHKGIAANYSKKKNESLKQVGVNTLVDVACLDEGSGSAALATVTASQFLTNRLLSEEVFGPYSLLVICKNANEMAGVIRSLSGQLTATLFAHNGEVKKYSEVVELLGQRCGRLIYNGVPTGVEVSKSMHHGGPFPSTTDSRFTSVGVDAIYRFVRPISFQDFPSELLPLELRNYNKLNILRCVDGVWTRNHIG